MKKLVLIALLLISNYIKGQTCTDTVTYDFIETYSWLGNWWTPAATTGFFTNTYVSSNASAALYGTGGGGSGIEQDWYSMPNVTGLNAAYTYKVRFRLGSYRFTGGATQGVDIPDFFEVQLSTNGGSSYTQEIRITGNNNAYWDYNTNGVITKTANGALSTYGPVSGGDRTAIGDGYSDITLTLPAGSTQCAVDFYCRANSSGEEWWIDNIQLLAIRPCVPLPIELLSFTGEPYSEYNLLKWITASETNNNYFTLERSYNGILFEEVIKVDGAGNSFIKLSYSAKDMYPSNNITYYKLSQTDFDGKTKSSELIAVLRKNSNDDLKVIKIYNLLGQEVDDNVEGIKIYYFNDGSIIKKYGVNQK